MIVTNEPDHPPGRRPAMAHYLLAPWRALLLVFQPLTTRLRRLYDWSIEVAGRPNAIWWLGLISFTESIFLPIPVDAPLAAAALAKPQRWFGLALMATIAGVLGGLVGYGLGAVFYETIGLPLLAAMGRGESVQEFRDLFDRQGWLIVFGGAFTPIPYKVIAITAGLGGYDLLLFCVASVVGRGMRFFLVAWLIYRFGDPIRQWIERRFGLATTLLFVVLAVAFVSLRWLLPS